MQSRIKFNPETKEFEIDGSEKFVRTYFDKIQKLFSEGEKKTVASNAAMPKAKGSKASLSQTVISLIQGSENGMTTAQLEDETGLDKKLIWSIIYRAEKRSLIKKVRRGMYSAALA